MQNQRLKLLKVSPTHFLHHLQKKANRQVSDSVPKGCEGTIVMIYTSPTIGYEVEFVDEFRNTIDIITVKEEDIVPVNNV